jgi:5-methylcytosine-specific restriction protein B
MSSTSTVPGTRREFGGRAYELAASPEYVYKTDSKKIHLPSCPHGPMGNVEPRSATQVRGDWASASDVPLLQLTAPGWCPDCVAVLVRSTSHTEPDRKRINEVGAAGRSFLQNALHNGRSSVDPTLVVWSADTAEALIASIMGTPIEGIEGFANRLRAQLDGESREVTLLAADLLYLHALPLSNWLVSGKVERVRHALDLLADKPELSEAMMEGIRLGGVFNGGIGFGTGIWRQLLWLARFVATWSNLPPAEKDEAWRDPWVFRRVVDAVPEPVPSMMNSLLFLAHCTYFDNVVNSDDKRRIRDAYLDVIDGSTGDDALSVDQDLYRIRTTLEADSDRRLDWYVAPWADRWMEAKPKKTRRGTPAQPTTPVSAAATDAEASESPVDFEGVDLLRATDELADSLNMPTTAIDEIIALLESRKQLIFYGPPGTGKTHLARAIGHHLTDSSAVRLVQFHPSYAYEDFFEGFRPAATGSGGVQFQLAPGPLRLIARDARDNPRVPHVLVIDEINRANIAKVFGELYFLLEYRDERIGLQYSPTESFGLPENLFLIATMNTSDRSIAMVDAAIRRRFAFVELHPSVAPVAGMLETWMARTGKSDERARVLASLNNAIGAELRDHHIGPSFVMRPDADSPEGLERIWRHDILPLLEEQFFGRLTRDDIAARFGLEALRRQVGRPESE